MNFIKPNFTNELKKFLNSNLNFNILFNSNPSGLIVPLTNNLCILDSSFNPPHKGHFSLVKQCILHNFNSDHNQLNITTINNKSVLLLLSVNNVDKKAQPAKFEDRLEMMYILASKISDELGISVSIGITKFAMFTDKSKEINSYINNLKIEENGNVTYSNNIKLIFLMGYDTLIRVLNPKYYLPHSLKDSLSEFMENCDLFTLTRSSASDAESSSTENNQEINSQFQYLQDIKENKIEGIPKEWGPKIHLVNGDSSSISISSSEIRKNVSLNKNESTKFLETSTFKEISDYIRTKNLYKL
ncbi:catalytic activity protein [[Candida] boidinii]|uniref:Unnamed protein product n=1 Tax=Candida boidinii TaxID=5477 RepID=A0ACB5U0A4_CANBO|nr:catalytic activity protein [[Candida] boidinii]OWB60476.1 catalytic activity protein [[Candida] boidinii]OWB71612.1 catalytic activity protein [[Candida] boidinii]GME97506.1 unnamed protein product [[Candida] boidinii]